MSESSSSSSRRRIVHLVRSDALLFSGKRRLSDCQDADDDSCEGGVAATAAFARQFATGTTALAAKSTSRSRSNHEDELELEPEPSKTLIMHRLDKQSQFVQTHPLGWSVNRLILHDYYGYEFYFSPPSILLFNKENDLSGRTHIHDLQTHDMPLVLTNAFVPPTISWYPYVERVHYDSATNLALLSLAGHEEQMVVNDIVGAVRMALEDIAKENELRQDCNTGSNTGHGHGEEEITTTTTTTTYGQFVAQNIDDALFKLSSTTILANNTTNNNNSQNSCWIPVVYFGDFDPEAFDNFITSMAALKHPPALIVDSGGNDINGTYTSSSTTTTTMAIQVPTPNSLYYNNTGMWVVGSRERYSSDGYYQKTLTLTDDNRRIARVDFTVLDLQDDMKPEYKDEQFAKDISFLRLLADQAQANDPVVGVSSEMPVARDDGDYSYRRCKGGECEHGNLFTDAIRWRSNSHVAFFTSGGLRGPGWPAGNVTLSNIWSTYPFPDTMCTGTMTGVSLFRLIDYSIGVATFESKETKYGGRLLQVSGMKIVYNTKLETKHRVISIDVWDETTQSYQPIERLKFYKFATTSYLCSVYDPFPTLLGEALVIDGEERGVVGDDLLQNIVGEYLTSMNTTYNATRQGRLTNDTSAMEPLNLVQTPEGCPAQTYWVETKLSCLNCPDSSHVQFSDEVVEFAAAESGIDEWFPGRIMLVNLGLEAFTVVPKSVPQWLVLTWSAGMGDDGPGNSTSTAAPAMGRQSQLLDNQQEDQDGHLLLQPGSGLALDFAVSAEHLEAGTAHGTVSFGVYFPGCTDNGDATFDVLLRVTPSPESNQLGNIRYVGFSLMGVALLTALSFAIWTNVHRADVVVQKMQPFFLIMICAGVGVLSLSMGSLSLDDEIVSLQWCDFGCMSMPWFASMGWTITFAAIYSKLWRINKLFSRGQFRRITVSERDALVTFGVLFGLNFIILLLWTLLDPMKWVRKSVSGESWNTYGICSSGSTGHSLMGLTIGVNVFALVLAVYEAYKSRGISGEFSEAKQMGMAAYTWLQLIAVSLPVLFLIDTENVTARYFLLLGLIFCLSITMLLNIFIPMVRKNDGSAGQGSNVKVSGLNPGTLPISNFSPRTLAASVQQSIPEVGHVSLFGSGRTSTRQSIGHAEAVSSAEGCGCHG